MEFGTRHRLNRSEMANSSLTGCLASECLLFHEIISRIARLFGNSFDLDSCTGEHAVKEGFAATFFQELFMPLKPRVFSQAPTLGLGYGSTVSFGWPFFAIISIRNILFFAIWIFPGGSGSL